MLYGVELLKEVFKEDTFREVDISKALKLSKNHAHYIRLQLTSNYEIVRVACGYYKFAKPVFVQLPPAIEFLCNELQKLGKKFVFTSATLFSDFFKDMPYEILVLYVEKGSARLFEKAIERHGSSYVALVEPKLHDFELLKNKAKINEFIVIREYGYFYSSMDGVASIEKAFVDLYFELTRRMLPLPNKTGDILGNLIQKNSINYTTLLKCAHERGLKKEILELLRNYTKKYGLPIRFGVIQHET